MTRISDEDEDEAGGSAEEDADADDADRDTADLDDVRDRAELRRRHYGLLQELRVLLPGVQVLLAFLLTAPFAQRFVDLDPWGRRAFAVALTSSMVSVVCLIGPVILHRVGERTARSARLRWGIRLALAGIVFLGVALVAALWGIARFVFGSGAAWWLVGPVLAVLGIVWVVVPLTLTRRAVSRPTRRG